MGAVQEAALKDHSIRQSINRASMYNKRMTQYQKTEALR